jgi:type VI secretion system protein ImpA
MASPEVLEFASLLEQIPGDKPTGSDLREDSSPNSLYYQIKDARSAARAAERLAQAPKEGEEPPRADWRPVLRNGQKVLAERTKDLEVVAFMIEALVRLNGFAGLRDGFRLARELVERYWDGLYPMPDEEGLATRIAPLTSLNGDDAEGTLITPIALVPIAEGGSGPYATYHYKQAAALAQVADEEARQKRIQQGALSMAAIERAVSETPEAFFVTCVDDLKQCQQEYDALGRALEERCNGQAPPTSNIRAALADCLDAVMTVARHKLPVAVGEPAAGGPAPTSDGEAGAAGAAGVAAGALRNREDALQRLLQVADFFRRTEPHTPVSYALEQAVRWGRMSLPELLTDLIQDENARSALFHRVGIRPAQGEGG